MYTPTNYLYLEEKVFIAFIFKINIHNVNQWVLLFSYFVVTPVFDDDIIKSNSAEWMLSLIPRTCLIADKTLEYFPIKYTFWATLTFVIAPTPLNCSISELRQQFQVTFLSWLWQRVALRDLARMGNVRYVRRSAISKLWSACPLSKQWSMLGGPPDASCNVCTYSYQNLLQEIRRRATVDTHLRRNHTSSRYDRDIQSSSAKPSIRFAVQVAEFTDALILWRHFRPALCHHGGLCEATRSKQAQGSVLRNGSHSSATHNTQPFKRATS